MIQRIKQNKYIIRISNGWRVKIKSGYYQTSKQFSSAKYSNIRNALIKAREWRNLVLKEWVMLESLNRKKNPDLSSDKNHACIGVYKVITKSAKGTVLYHWCARAQTNKVVTKRTWSLNKHGSCHAFINACAFRYEHCGTIIILNDNLIPCSPTVPHRTYDE